MNWNYKSNTATYGLFTVSGLPCLSRVALSLISLSLISLSLIALSLIALGGCSKSENASRERSNTISTKEVDPSHGGWWCVEHGVPESECARCDKSLVAKFKETGDWCKEHDRPESQCFICGPKRFEKFAAVYEVKTGRQPPKPTE